MTKKKEHSFGDEAKRIAKQYPRRTFDSIEKKDYEIAMDRLVDEQEQAREAMGLNNPGEFGNGGRMTYEGGSTLPTDFEIQSNIALSNKFPKIPGNFEVQSGVDLANTYRGQHTQMPLSTRLGGIQPGNTEVTSSATGDPYKQGMNPMIRRNYTADDPSSWGGVNYINDLALAGAGNPQNYNYAPNSNAGKGSFEFPNNIGNLGSQNSIIPSYGDTMGMYNQGKQINTIGNGAISQQPINNNFIPGNSIQGIGTPQIGQPVQQPRLGIDKLKAWGESQVNNQNGSSFLDKNKQYLPSAISGLSNIGGNLLLAALSKKNTPRITPNYATLQRMNLEPQAEQMRGDARTTKNINMRNARNLGLNAGATMANVSAANVGADRGLGANLTNLYGQQERFNVGSANQFALANQQAGNRASMFNTQMGARSNQNRLDYLSGALGTLPGVMQDINLRNADEETRKMYQNYINTMGRNYQYNGNLFGMNPMQHKVRRG